MPTAKVYNLDGSVKEEIELPHDVFGLFVNRALLHQVLGARALSQRTASAHTQRRGEVRGGGRKPWKQKGTGRARHSSIRSPLWKGGGVVFGPRNERNWTRKVNAKALKKALATALSAKLKSGKLVFMDALGVSISKTKEFIGFVEQLQGQVAPCKGIQWRDLKRNELLTLVPDGGEILKRVSRNVPGMKTMSVRDVAIEDVVGYRYIVTAPGVIPILVERCKLRQSQKSKVKSM